MTTIKSDIKKRIGLVGAGDHGLSALGEVIHRANHLDLSVVVDPSEAQRVTANERFPNAKCYQTCDDPGIDYDCLDLLIVATPPFYLAQVTMQLIGKGKHQLIEKPGALTAAQLEALAAASPSVRVGYSYRFHPTIQKVLEIIAARGMPEHFELSFSSPILTAGTWRDSRTKGGGALRDLGSHLIDLAKFFIGEHIEIIDVINASHKRNIIKLRAGVVPVLIKCSFGCPAEFRVQARFDGGSLVADLWSMTTPVFVPHDRSGFMQTLRARIETKTFLSKRSAPLLLQSRLGMLDSALIGGGCLTSVADAADTLRLIEEIEKA